MREHELRRALLTRLARLHADDGSLIVQEFGLDNGYARVDVAVINGQLTGFEIKSDRDSLTRLPGQSASYNAVFDRVYVVVGPKLLRRVHEQAPAFWGIWTTDPGAQDMLGEQRPAELNPHRNARMIAQLLWRGEACELLAAHGRRGMERASRNILWNELASLFTLDELAATVRHVLKSRTRWSIARPSLSDDGLSPPGAMS